MNTVTIENGKKKQYEFAGRGSITINLRKGTKVETEIRGGHQQLVLKSAIVHRIRRGPNSTIELKGNASFDVLTGELDPSATVTFKVDRRATMSVTADREKASFNVRIVL